MPVQSDQVTPSTRAELVALVPRAGQALVVGVGLLYAVGLIVVNLDLAVYGVTSHDLARPEYVLVGVLWALLATPSIGSVAFLSHARERFRRREYGPVVTYALIVLLLGVVLPLATALFFVASAPETVLPKALAVAVTNVAAAGTFWFFTWLSRPSSQASSAARTDAMALAESALSVVVAVVMLGIMLTFGLLIYSYELFPHLGRHFGGGSRPVVELLLTADSGAGIRELGLPMRLSGDSSWIGPVILLLDGQEHLVLARERASAPNVWPRPQAVSLSRRYVAAVRVLGLSPNQNP
jgi:hypothetical protein